MLVQKLFEKRWKSYVVGEILMNDWMRIQSIFANRVEALQRKLPIYLDHRLLYDYQKVSFWIQACPGFDVKIYITPALIGTYVDQDHCDLSCDFDAGIEFTVRFVLIILKVYLLKKSFMSLV